MKEQIKKGNKKSVGFQLSHDPIWKFISLFGLIIGGFITLILAIALLIWLLGKIGFAMDIATYNINKSTGVNIWSYITPMFVYFLLAGLYYFVAKYLWKYKSYYASKIGLVLLGLGTLLLAYNAYLSIHLIHAGNDSSFVLHMMSNGRALLNINNPIGVCAIHILVFMLPGLIIAALQIPENNYD